MSGVYDYGMCSVNNGSGSQMAIGNYVTEKQIGKVEDIFWDDEQVEFIAKGNNVTAKYQGSTESFDNTKGWPRMVATDQRVFIKVPKLLNTKVESLGFDELSAADTGSSGLTGTEIKLRTVRGKTYIFKADEPGEAEIEEMVNYIRDQLTGEKPSETDNSNFESNSTTQMSSGTARSAARKTESCVKCGESVSDGVSRCSNCGYNPGEHRKWLYIHLVLTAVLILTVVGIPLGIFTYLKARKHNKLYKRGVTG